MLLVAAVQAIVTRIVGAWFGADRVIQVSMDPVAFPGFNEVALGSALFESSRLFIDVALWGQPQGLPGLLQSPTIFLNASLAEAYGVEFDGADPEQFVAYDMPDERSGVLTQPALMAAYASSLETSVVKRGLFIVRRAMCLPEPPAPTPAIFALATAQAADFSLTEKQKAAYRADPANPCAGCHGLVDPYGLVFENFDAIGRYRESFPNGELVDASATMQESSIFTEDRLALDEDFTELVTGAREFIDYIGETDQFAFCASRQLYSYALGRPVDESCVERDLDAGLIRREMTIGEVIKNVVLDELTRTRGGE
jgi:hypothetical protein